MYDIELLVRGRVRGNESDGSAGGSTGDNDSMFGVTCSETSACTGHIGSMIVVVSSGETDWEGRFLGYGESSSMRFCNERAL